METYIVIAIILIIIIIALTYFFKSRKSTGNNNPPTNIRSREYRTNIYNNTPAQYQNNIRYLYDKLDTLDAVINKNTSQLNNQATQIAQEVLTKANNAEQDIANYWARKKQKADFYFYIGLHYTSFTLADKLTKELDALKSYVALLTEMINTTQKRIDVLKVNIDKGNSYNIASLKREHSELCKKCDALRKTRNVCISQRDIVRKRRDEQNIITGRRRDYIGTHFGSKGRQWRASIMSKHRR